MLVEFRVHEVFLRTANKKRGQSTSECSHTMIDSLTLEAEQPRKCCEQAFSSSPRSELRVRENRGDLQPRLLTTSPTATHRSSPQPLTARGSTKLQIPWIGMVARPFICEVSGAPYWEPHQYPPQDCVTAT